MATRKRKTFYIGAVVLLMLAVLAALFAAMFGLTPLPKDPVTRANHIESAKASMPLLASAFIFLWGAIFSVWKLVDDVPNHHGVRILDVVDTERLRAVPEDLSVLKAYMYGAPVLHWLTQRQYLSPWFETHAAEEINRYRQGQSTALEFYRDVDGVLATDMMTERVGIFLAGQMYTVKDVAKPWQRYLQRTAQQLQLPSKLHILDQPTTYEAANRYLDETYAKFLKFGKFRAIYWWR